MDLSTNENPILAPIVVQSPVVFGNQPAANPVTPPKVIGATLDNGYVLADPPLPAGLILDLNGNPIVDLNGNYIVVG